jgi:hypothetical protein
MVRRLSYLLVIFFAAILVLPAYSIADPIDSWNWRSPLPQGNTLNDVAFGNGTFVAVGYLGTILTSPDGTAWTPRTSGTTNTLAGVVFANGRFVAVGQSGTILTSPDGMAWTVRASGTSNRLNGVTFAKVFVVVGDNGTILASPDGVNWTARASGTNNSLWKVTFGNGTFVAVGRGIVISSDTLTWRPISLEAPDFEFPFFQAIAFGNGKFVAGYVDLCWLGCLGGGIVTSSDGETWEKISLWRLASLTFENGLFVGSYGDSFYTSSDGATWTAAPSAAGEIGYFFRGGITYGSGVFVAVGGFGEIETSPDGTTWTSRTFRASDTSLLDVTYAKGTFVAVGDNTIVTSSDGSTWISRTLSDPRPSLRAVTFGNDTFLAVGTHLYTSPDGATWTLVGYGFEDIAFGNGTFVAVAGDTIVTSPDGSTWTIRSPFRNTASFNAVTFANDMFVAVGSSIWTSPDGVTWTPRVSEAPNMLNEVAFGNGVFVAVGNGGTIVTSPEGVNWTPQDSGIEVIDFYGGVIDLHGVAFGDGLFVAAGGNGTILTSSIGATWTRRASGTNNSLNGAVFNNGTFVVVGAGTILQSHRLSSTDVKANNSDEAITLRTADTLSITASLATGDGSGISADWWVVADTPIGLYYFAPPGIWYLASDLENIRPAYEGPLFDLAPVEVLNMTGLPAGTYVFYFGVDTNMNGHLDYPALYFDYVFVTIE